MQALGYKTPVMPQSMYIFKQPLIGESVSFLLKNLHFMLKYLDFL